MTDLSRAALDILIADRRLDEITNGTVAGRALDAYADAWRALEDAVAKLNAAMALT